MRSCFSMETRQLMFLCMVITGTGVLTMLNKAPQLATVYAVSLFFWLLYFISDIKSDIKKARVIRKELEN